MMPILESTTSKDLRFCRTLVKSPRMEPKDTVVLTEAGPPMNTTFDRQASPNGGLGYLIQSFMQGHETRVPSS